jgi:quinol monooxygenase YgiN
MELFIFGRFHARAGCGCELENAFSAVVEATRAEPGCLSIRVFALRGIGDSLTCILVRFEGSPAAASAPADWGNNIPAKQEAQCAA